MSAGSTICLSAFDANQFWDVVEDHNPTWYYASPTMHSVILASAKDRAIARANSRIRLVCNAAGGLLPSLAQQLQDTFRCTVLPSYGMTECMPISTPPLNYRLERSGTSGISAGPEIAIHDIRGDLVSPNVVGSIMVRSLPVFQGYLCPDGTLDTSVLSVDGWFDTGDIGYLDGDGYLFITGRSKEVINRGGELISPFEVEDAVMTSARTSTSSLFGRVEEVLAFPVPHETLQEVVAVALVVPQNIRRPDLRTIQKCVKSSLHQSKWPAILVYMDALPRNNNKVLRLNLADRLRIPAVHDQTTMFARHFMARCPLPNTPLSESIYNQNCVFDVYSVTEIALGHVPDHINVIGKLADQSGLVSLVLAPRTAAVAVPDATMATDLQTYLSSVLDDLMVPEQIKVIAEPFPLTVAGFIDNPALQQILARQATSPFQQACLTPTQRIITQLFSYTLHCPREIISPKSSFFELGGDSLKAGQLLAYIRKEFSVRLPVEILFAHPEVMALSEAIDDRLSAVTSPHDAVSPRSPLPDCAQTYSSTNFFLLCIQLIPLTLLYPMKRALSWTLWVYAFTATQNISTSETVLGRLFNLIATLALANLIVQIVSPLLGIFAKWVIIWKYKQGLYPMWGLYHTRWWLTQKTIAVAGMGVFRHFNWSRILYYRLMGVKMGRNVTIHQDAILGEYDLLSLGHGVVLDRCICRPFAAERNTSMYLGRIVLGEHATVGLAAVVAPGSVVPANVCIGPNSCSWELQDAVDSNRDLLSSKIAAPHWLMNLFTLLLLGIVNFIGSIPWMIGLIGLLATKLQPASDKLSAVLIWFASDYRITFHYLARILHTILSPFFVFATVLLIRYILKSIHAEPNASGRFSQLQIWKRALITQIYPNTSLQKLTDLFGTHYEPTSQAIRLLGGNVGERVYWSGTGPSMEYDSIEIGDDVVFGSRSHLVSSDGMGSSRIKIGAGAMVSDRCVILPGVSIGENAILGSGAMTRRGKSYAPGSTWVGCKKGDAVCLSEPTISESSGLQSRFSFDEATANVNAVEHGRWRTRLWGRKPQHRDINQLHAQAVTQHLKRKLLGQSKLPASKSQSRKFRSKPKIVANVHEIELSATPSLDPSTDSSDVEKDDNEKSFCHSRTSLFSTTPTSPPDLVQTPTTSSSPFGRAFYQGQAPYHVLGLPTIVLYSTFITVFTAFYWSVASTSSVQLIVATTSPHHILRAEGNPARPLILFALFTLAISFVLSLQALLALAITIAAKWLLLGRRIPGSYDWDKSSYCQRWQLFLTIERIRRHCYASKGILDLLTGTHYIVLYFRAMGLKAGKDCALFAGGRPSLLLTEPDLVELGDRVAVDDASLVAHINTRGNFTLNRLSVGDRSVLRSGSRLLSGARMEKDTCLLEHTLVMAGDTVDEGCTIQGWPGELFQGERVRL